MEKARILNVASATYLFICGIASLYFLIIVLVQNDIVSFLTWFSFFCSIAVVLTTIFNNYKILSSLSKINKTNIVLNLFICVPQVINISINGFQFKFNQGFEFIFYTNLENVTKKVNLGLYFLNINYLLNIKFLESNYSIVGINLINLFLFLFYLSQYRKMTIVNKMESTHLD